MTDNVVGIFTSINDVNVVKDLVELFQSCENDVTITTADNHYKINAKSILGVLSMNLSRPVCIVFDDEDDYESIKETLEKMFRINVTCRVAKTKAVFDKMCIDEDDRM